MDQLQFEAIGTRWTVGLGLLKSSDDDFQPHLERKILEKIDCFEKTYSRFRDDSVIMKMAREPGEYQLPLQDKDLWIMYEKMYRLTDGLMTPLVGKVLVEAGYDKKYSLKPTVKRTPPPTWEEVMVVDWPMVNIKKPVQLDFGAAGKGFLIDVVAELLEKEGILDYCIEAGGDIVYKTTISKKLRVGLENPNNKEQAIGVMEITNGAICGSAGNRRRWGEFNHVFNPRTLESMTNLAAVWVIASDTMTADALTTALYFCPAEKLKKEFDFEYLKLNNDFSIEKSNGFEAELFTR